MKQGAHYQAVDLVKNIDPCDMGIRAKAELLGESCCLGWVCTSLQDVGGAEGDGVDVRELFPRGVDFWTRILAVDGGRISWAERAVSFDCREGDVDLIQNWCCSNINRCH